jgi:hypothetical protein
VDSIALFSPPNPTRGRALRAEQRRQSDLARIKLDAAIAIARVDRALARTPARRDSWCARCRATIATTALRCNSCGFDFLAPNHRSQTRARADYADYAGVPIEYSGHEGRIIGIR